MSHLQFAEDMGDAEAMDNVVVCKIGFPEIVDGFPLEERQKSYLLERFGASLIMDVVVGQQLGGCEVEPSQTAIGPHVSLVKVDELGVSKQLPYFVHRLLHRRGESPEHIHDCSLTQGDAEKIPYRLGGPLKRDELLIGEIDGDGIDAWAVLNGAIHPYGKRAPDGLSAPWTGAAEDLMLDHLDLGRRRKVVDLPRHQQSAGNVGGGATAFARAVKMSLDPIRCRSPFERLSWMSRLTTRLAAAFLAQTDGLRLFAVAVAGRRLRAVRAVLREAGFEFRVLFDQLLVFCDKPIQLLSETGQSHLKLGVPCEGGAFVHETVHGHIHYT